jgi:hypothetical protein
MNQKLIEDWRRCLANVSNQLVGLHERLAVWKEYARRFRAAPPAEHEFVHDWIIANYVDSMAIGIRRVVFPAGRDTVSLIGLLNAIAHDPDTLTLEDAVAFWGRDCERRIDKHRKWLLDRFFTNPNSTEIDRRRVCDDKTELESDAHVNRIRELASRHVAHLIPSRTLDAVSFDDIDVALDLIDRHTRDYSILLVASGPLTFEPVFAGDWTSTLDRLFSGTPPRG